MQGCIARRSCSKRTFAAVEGDRCTTGARSMRSLSKRPESSLSSTSAKRSRRCYRRLSNYPSNACDVCRVPGMLRRCRILFLSAGTEPFGSYRYLGIRTWEMWRPFRPIPPSPLSKGRRPAHPPRLHHVNNIRYGHTDHPRPNLRFSNHATCAPESSLSPLPAP